MADGQLGSDLFAQAVLPSLDDELLQLIAQTLQIKTLDHGRATSGKVQALEPRHHWLRTLEQALAMYSRLSGFMTFSRALRFWAISSSLYVGAFEGNVQVVEQHLVLCVGEAPFPRSVTARQQGLADARRGGRRCWAE